MAILRYNTKYAPPATMVLVVLNVCIAVADMLSNKYLARLLWARGTDVQYGDYWRLLTCGFAHGSVLHIAFNAYGIYILGNIFERFQGTKAFLIVYFTALMGGSALAMSFMDPEIPLLGASGAAYGLFGAVIGMFYAKTGSLKALVQIPFTRMLLIWLAFGVFMSLQPGISFLGHLGGFLPGLILGVYFEHRYARNLDVYHKLSVGLVAAGVVLLTAFACVPVTRGSWHAAQALRAYEAGDLEAGDKRVREAKRRPGPDGSRKLITHLESWRKGNTADPRKFNTSVLRLPLTHPGGIGVPGAEDMPFTYLKAAGDEPEALESEQAEP